MQRERACLQYQLSCGCGLTAHSSRGIWVSGAFPSFSSGLSDAGQVGTCLAGSPACGSKWSPASIWVTGVLLEAIKLAVVFSDCLNMSLSLSWEARVQAEGRSKSFPQGMKPGSHSIWKSMQCKILWVVVGVFWVSSLKLFLKSYLQALALRNTMWWLALGAAIWIFFCSLLILSPLSSQSELFEHKPNHITWILCLKPSRVFTMHCGSL